MCEEVSVILQPNTEGQSKPYPIALMSDQNYAFIASDLDTIPLEEALSQPDRE